MRVLFTLALVTAAAVSAQTVHLQAQLTTAVKLKKAKAGDKLKARTVASVTLANGTTIPTGSSMLGQVLQVDAGLVSISFDTANVEGHKIPLNVTLVAVAMIGGAAGNSNAKMDSPSPDDHALNGGPRSTVQAGAKTLDAVGHESLSEVNAGGSSHARMVAAHSGSVIGLPGVAMVVDDGPPFASRFTITAKDMRLPDGVQLMFSVR